jgi:hypothetical protein
MQNRYFRLSALCSAVLLAACDGALAVTNPNVVDVDAAFRTPQGIQQVIGKSFQGIFQGQYANLNSLMPQAMNSSGESSSSLANAGMGLRTGIPRQIIDNQLGNTTVEGNFRDLSFFTRFARQAANGIKALRGLNRPDAETAKARALGFFVIGYAQGNMAFMYDSAAAIRPDTTDESVLSSSAAVMTNALLMLDSAIAIASNPLNATAFPILASEFINGTSLTSARFIQVARSYKAKFRAGVARTPAERALVDWTRVEADAANGITADLTVGLDGTIGWSIGGTIGQLATFGGWHQMPMLYYGMADTTGAYNSYIAVGSFVTARTGFLVQTADTRWPRGATRAVQQAAQSPVVPSTGVYFRNRPSGEDVNDNGNPWANSNYDHFRWRPINDAAGIGTWTLMSFREISMLRAEALIRLNRTAEAIPLINASRAANGLPAIPAGATVVPGGTSAAPVIGGQSCTPRVPVSATTTACGSVLEAMKYEKRMESAFTGYCQWFIDNRGWGDLVAGTPIEWPVPVQEMNSRNKVAYNGLRVQAAPSTYFF